MAQATNGNQRKGIGGYLLFNLPTFAIGGFFFVFLMTWLWEPLKIPVILGTTVGVAIVSHNIVRSNTYWRPELWLLKSIGFAILTAGTIWAILSDNDEQMLEYIIGAAHFALIYVIALGIELPWEKYVEGNRRVRGPRFYIRSILTLLAMGLLLLVDVFVEGIPLEPFFYALFGLTVVYTANDIAVVKDTGKLWALKIVVTGFVGLIFGLIASPWDVWQLEITLVILMFVANYATQFGLELAYDKYIDEDDEPEENQPSEEDVSE